MLGQRELILGSFESLFIQLYESEEPVLSCFVSANCVWLVKHNQSGVEDVVEEDVVEEECAKSM